MERMSSAGSAPPSSVPSPAARIRRESGWLVAASLAGLAVIALALCAVQYHREREATLQVLTASTAERAAMLDALLAAAAAPVAALRRRAETTATAPDANDLARFSRLLPALADLAFLPGGEGGGGAAGEPRWSAVHPDHASNTLRVTYGEAAVRDGRPVGTVSAEIVLDFLPRLVAMPDYSGQRLVLADRDRHVIADSRVGPAPGRSAALALGEILPPGLVSDEALAAAPGSGIRGYASQSHAVLAVPLATAPWVLVCLVPEGALFLRVMPWLSMTLALFVAVFVVLAGAQFYVSRRFVQPALSLVRLVVAETSGDVLPPQRVPPLWQPLVGRVAAAFAAGRAETARAQGESGHLAALVGRQTEELARIGAALGSERGERRSLDAILGDAPAVVMVLDREGCIVHFNRWCERLSGVSASRALGQRPWEFLVPRGDAELARVQIATALRDDGPIRGELHWLNPDGPPHRLLWSLAAVAGDNGELAFVVAIGQELQSAAEPSASA